MKRCSGHFDYLPKVFLLVSNNIFVLLHWQMKTDMAFDLHRCNHIHNSNNRSNQYENDYIDQFYNLNIFLKSCNYHHVKQTNRCKISLLYITVTCKSTETKVTLNTNGTTHKPLLSWKTNIYHWYVRNNEENDHHNYEDCVISTPLLNV